MTSLFSLCPSCLDRLNQTLTDRRPSGTLRLFCKHHGVMFSSIVEEGLIVNWTMMPGRAKSGSEASAEPASSYARYGIDVE